MFDMSSVRENKKKTLMWTIISKSDYGLLLNMLGSYRKSHNDCYPWIFYDIDLEESQKSKIREILSCEVKFKKINHERYKECNFSNKRWNNTAQDGMYNPAYRFEIFLEEEEFEKAVYVDSDFVFLKEWNPIDEVLKIEKSSKNTVKFTVSPRHFNSKPYGGELFNMGYFVIDKSVCNLKNHQTLVDMCKTGNYKGNQMPLNEWALSLGKVNFHSLDGEDGYYYEDPSLICLSPYYNITPGFYGSILKNIGDKILFSKIKGFHFAGPKVKNFFSNLDNLKKLTETQRCHASDREEMHDTYKKIMKFIEE